MAGNGEALRAASKVVADAVKKFAAARTPRTADATHVVGDDLVSAGSPGGQWGWEPITAWMFQTGAAHPLFGNKGHWYNQPHYPFLDLAAEASATDAANAYADIRIPQLLDEYLP